MGQKSVSEEKDGKIHALNKSKIHDRRKNGRIRAESYWTKRVNLLVFFDTKVQAVIS
ncbi:hypothetical protein [Cytobacillus kochii]